MNIFGKTLVFIHAGLSFVLFGVALVIFTHRIPWNTPKNTGGERVQGIVAKYQQELQQIALPGLAASQAQYNANRGQVEQQEAVIAADRAQFGQEMQHLTTDAKSTTPARGIKRDAFGQVALDQATGRPTMQALTDSTGTAPLLALNTYRDMHNQQVTVYTEKADQLDTAAKLDKDSTELLRGEKGLHAKIQREVKKQDKLAKGQKELRPKYINSAVELELLRNLRDRLESRIKELQEAAGTLDLRP